MISFENWLEMVDRQLVSKGLGVRVHQIDRAFLEQQYAQEAAPYLVASLPNLPVARADSRPAAEPEAALAAPGFPLPDRGMLRFLYKLFTVAAWVVWILTLAVAALGIIGIVRAGGKGLELYTGLLTSIAGMIMGGASLMLTAQAITLWVGIHARLHEKSVRIGS